MSTLVLDVRGMHPDDPAPYATGFGIPAYAIADFEFLDHGPHQWKGARQAACLNPAGGPARVRWTSLGLPVRDLLFLVPRSRIPRRAHRPPWRPAQRRGPIAQRC